MDRVLPVVAELASRFPERTIFTRLLTPERPEDMPGMWRHYYERWRDTTREHVDPQLLELVDPLNSLVPPATVIEKTRHFSFAGSQLLSHVRARKTDTLVVTGSETDVCVLATVLDAVDLGYRVILVRDAVCSFSDEGGMTPCSKSITAATACRSRQRMPSKSCEYGNDVKSPRRRPLRAEKTQSILPFRFVVNAGASGARGSESMDGNPRKASARRGVCSKALTLARLPYE
jgi:nicotinamidase-related amidase